MSPADFKNQKNSINFVNSVSKKIKVLEFDP